MTTHILTDEEKERIYDLERSGQVYTLAPAAQPTAPVIRIMADGTPNKYDTGEWSFERTKEYTPLGALSTGAQVYGLHDVDGSAHCVRIETADGCMYAGEDGVFSGVWAGRDLELTTDMVQAFRRLFVGDMLEQLMTTAMAWERGDALPLTTPCDTSRQLVAAQTPDDADDENPLTPEEEAAYDAANQQKVYDRIKSAFDQKDAAPLFVDTLPGRVNDVPIDLLVTMGIGAAMERNAIKLGITRDQLFRILEVAVNPVINEYLITPERRMRLIWDGME